MLSRAYGIEALNLSKVYPGGVEAVKDVTLRVRKGVVTSLLGPNGAGKTTLLNMISGILPPTRGRVLIMGEDLWASRRARELLGFTPQEGGVWSELTVYENLMMAASLYDVPTREARQRVRELIDLFGLDKHVRKVARRLSGGLRRRLSVAMALIHDPPVIVLDEPTSGLDPAARAGIMRLFRTLASRGKTVLLSTHISEDAELSDFVAIVNSGRLIAEGSPNELKRRVLRTRSFIEIGLSADVDAVRAAKVLTAMGINVSVAGDKVIVKAEDGESLLPQIMRRLDSEGIDVRWAEIRKPTLSDAFRALTGEEVGEGG